jgi:hypothetical protein
MHCQISPAFFLIFPLASILAVQSAPSHFEKDAIREFLHRVLRSFDLASLIAFNQRVQLLGCGQQ